MAFHYVVQVATFNVLELGHMSLHSVKLHVLWYKFLDYCTEYHYLMIKTNDTMDNKDHYLMIHLITMHTLNITTYDPSNDNMLTEYY